MKIKKLLLALMMLIAYSALSQGDTIRKPVCFAFETSKNIELDLQELDRHKALYRNAIMKLTNTENRLKVMTNNFIDMESVYSLLKTNYNIVVSQYEAEKLKQPKSNWFIWTLAVIGALGVGYTIGNLN